MKIEDFSVLYKKKFYKDKRGNAQLRGKYIFQNGGKRSKKIDGKKNIVWLLGLSALQV